MAKQMIYTARNIKADEALRIGLVNAVYPQEELMAAAEKMAAGIAKNAPIAVRNCKKAINDGLDVSETASRRKIRSTEWHFSLTKTKKK